MISSKRALTGSLMLSRACSTCSAKNRSEQRSKALPMEFRMVVLLADVEGFAYKEIAEILGIPRGTVMSRLFRGRRLLQRSLWDQAQAAGISKAREG